MPVHDKFAGRGLDKGTILYLWWDRYAGGWTFKCDEWRYYLYRAHAYPYHWLLRRGYDEERVMTQGVESYREFVAQCEEYVNERHGQCSLWEEG